MSLQVKFAGRGAGPSHTCTTCGYVTRHRAMFERHTKRCNTESAPATSVTTEGEVLPSPPVCRNYRCEKCGYATSKSQAYLEHRRMVHSENFSIYPCDVCEYASRHKSKVLRHRNLVHRDAPPHPSFPQEMMGGSSIESVEGTDGGEKRSAEDMDDEYDENQNTPVKKQRSDTNSLSSPESITNSPSATIIDPTDDAYNYIATGGNGQSLHGCMLCDYGHHHKWKVANHVRNVHMRKTLFKCPQCEFVTERKIEWCVHKTTHTEKHVHSCNQCSYRTTKKKKVPTATLR